jgi:pyruvate formate lyase activating enzyme
MTADKAEPMVFAGLQKTSLIDFPGKVACVAFVTGCNFACPYCHNPDLARGRYPQRISEQWLLSFLHERREWIDGVVISGGEPTLHPRLAALCRGIHDAGLAVKVDTNGSRPEVLDDLIRARLIDYVAMDIKTALDRYAPPLAPGEASAAVAQSIRIILQSGLDHEFRTTCVRPFIAAPVVTRIAAAIQGAGQYTLQTFRSTTVLNPGFFKTGDPGFSPGEMRQLRELAAPFVQKCIVR